MMTGRRFQEGEKKLAGAHTCRFVVITYLLSEFILCDDTCARMLYCLVERVALGIWSTRPPIRCL